MQRHRRLETYSPPAASIPHLHPTPHSKRLSINSMADSSQLSERQPLTKPFQESKVVLIHSVVVPHTHQRKSLVKSDALLATAPEACKLTPTPSRRTSLSSNALVGNKYIPSLDKLSEESVSQVQPPQLIDEPRTPQAADITPIGIPALQTLSGQSSKSSLQIQKPLFAAPKIVITGQRKLSIDSRTGEESGPILPPPSIQMLRGSKVKPRTPSRKEERVFQSSSLISPSMNTVPNVPLSSPEGKRLPWRFKNVNLAHYLRLERKKSIEGKSPLRVDFERGVVTRVPSIIVQKRRDTAKYEARRCGSRGVESANPRKALMILQRR